MSKNKIVGIQVFGERNTGTNFVRKLFRDNVPDVGAFMGKRGFGWKHGDLGQPWGYYEEDGKTYFTVKIRDYKKESDDVLFIVVSRNPIIWLQSSNKQPHHAPELYLMGFSKFLRHPWRSYRGKRGQDFSRFKKVRMSMVKKKNLYEDFKTPIDLRNEKNKTFEDFRKKVQNVAYVNYETVSKNPKEVLAAITDFYGMNYDGSYQNISEDKFGFGKFKAKEYSPISAEDYKYIYDNIDHEMERQIGYTLDKPPIRKKSFLGREIKVDGNKAVKIKGEIRCFKGSEEKSISV